MNPNAVFPLHNAICIANVFYTITEISLPIFNFHVFFCLGLETLIEASKQTGNG